MRSSVSSLFLVGAIAVSASATSYRDAATSSLAPADGSVSGWVRSVHAERSGRHISTRVTLERDNPGPGEATMIELRAPGGTVDGITMRVSGAPRFEVGEHVRVTLRATRDGLRLAGLAGGKVVLP